MARLDASPNVLQWSSEEFCIPYRSPIDGRVHRYFPDFWVKQRNKNGEIIVRVIEVKPRHQCIEPKKQTKLTKRYLEEVKTWGVNTAKWKAAEEFCAQRHWHFNIMTEKELGIKY